MAAFRLSASALRHFNSKSTVPLSCFFPKKYFSLSTAAMGKFMNLEVKDGVAVLKLDAQDSKVNTLNLGFKPEFDEAINKVLTDPSISSAVIISGKPDCFIAGADIGMIESCKSKEEAAHLSRMSNEQMDLIENCKKPFVAAIMGSCLGGGLEVALACHYRLAVKTKKTVLGLPEVMLGLLPGSGGTQRLPRELSFSNAFDLLLTGKTLTADKAKRVGLVHGVISELGPGLKPATERTLEYLEEVAIKTAQDLAAGSLKVSPRKKNMQDKIMDWLLKYQFGRNFLLNQVRSKVMQQSRGLYPAPLKIIDVVKTKIEKGMKAGYALESEYFGELAMTKESSALRGLFHGQTACKKNTFGKPKKRVETLGVLGAGLMGAGIVQVSVDKGIGVVMKDVTLEGLAKGQQQIQKGLDSKVKRKKMTSFERDQLLSAVDATLDYKNFKKCDMVIEAVFEEINVKHKVVKEIEQHIPEHCILATNTSALPIGLVAQASKRPENVVGMHYFSPVDKMQLLEIIMSDKTSKETAAAAYDVGLRQGKVVIGVKDTPGFYVNRVVTYILTEMAFLLQEGMSPKDIDKAGQQLGFHTGIATVLDEVGIDVATHMLEFMAKEVSNVRNTGLWTEFVAAGFLGRKAGKGLFMYDGSKSKSREINPQALEIIEKYRIPAKLPLTNDLAAERMLALFVNEAVRCLELGIIQTAAEGDIGAVFGIGFPPCLGGPFRYVDNYGADTVVAKMQELEQVYGSSFTPCQLLLDHAKDTSKKFLKI